jgi:hypothetical protein
MISDHPRTDQVLPGVSVIMPTFEQAHFIGRALESLVGQTFRDWEAIIVDDGSQEGTAAALAPWLADPRLRCLRHARNGGLGRALNTGLDAARAPLVAYLPSDDVWYRDHLAMLVALLEREPGAVLAYSGLRYRYNRTSSGAPPDGWLQLVQCLHRQVALRWLERADIESDDLGRLFWARLACHGEFTGTGTVSCEWVDHPAQRHKLMREPLGGINPFRSHYRIAEPLRFHASTGNPIDEVAMYAELRGGADEKSDAGLKIVLAGELAYNPDRVLALRALGHRLHGLWTPQPYWFNTVGPLPFDGVHELPREGWSEALAALEPDLIYAQLNWQAVPFAHALMLARFQRLGGLSMHVGGPQGRRGVRRTSWQAVVHSPSAGIQRPSSECRRRLDSQPRRRSERSERGREQPDWPSVQHLPSRVELRRPSEMLWLAEQSPHRPGSHAVVVSKSQFAPRAGGFHGL